MLPILFVVALLSGLGFFAVAATARYTSRRLRLDLSDAAVWLGLAEAPVDELAARRGKAVAHQPSLGNTAGGTGAL